MADLDPVDTERAVVAKGKARDKLRAEEELNNLRAVISTSAGRHIIWRQLEKAAVFEALDVRSTCLMANVAVQNSAKELLKECLTADPNFYNIAQFEAIERGKRLGK